jgi:thioredoxin reductase
VLDVQRQNGGFVVSSDQGRLRARRVVLAVGRRGSPRKLGVPGEETEKVAYRLLEPERWTGSRVLVVGGGNSAVEAAVSLAEAGANVTLSYRGGAFNRVAPANRERLEAQRGHALAVLLDSNVVAIEREQVCFETPSGRRNIGNDQVFVLIGGELPSEFLHKLGVQMRWHHGRSFEKAIGAR